MGDARGVAVGEMLTARRDAGHKLLGPYVTGQLSGDWLDIMSVYVESGADVIEVGIPFSDPVMDGPTIQAASSAALERGATPLGILADLATVEWPIPVVVMTYYNLALHVGLDRFAAEMAAAGVRGVILPDVPIEELGPWWAAAEAHGVETVGLVGPVTPDDRLARVCDAASGFIYGVNLMGVTGERSDVSADSAVLAGRINRATTLPALMGFGISTPDQAAAVSAASDGVIVASAIMRRLLEGGTPDDAGAFVAELRQAIDQVN
ncbi:MAG TPA: tryptophan synthase subunit alpha [Acidimicrobiales bacterium]|nr:tryptophan synthase subunit alpha [Acidimicrobiales bacterium]